jgi:nuclease S1
MPYARLLCRARINADVGDVGDSPIYSTSTGIMLLILLALVGAPLKPETNPPQLPRWGYDGHRIVCRIAWLESDDQTRSAIRSLLALDDRYDDFTESCLWADAVRREGDYERFTTAHYMNVPRGADGVSAEADCSGTYCVVEGIVDMKAILDNDGFSDQERLDALKFLSHFVGDIHQPLHAGYGDDRGGNSTRVTVFGKTANLHSTWDYRLIEHRGQEWDAYADSLQAAITVESRRTWSGFDPERWAWESYQIVERSVYDYAEDNVIGEEYYRKNISTVEKQLQKAGYRLAMTLDEIFE